MTMTSTDKIVSIAHKSLLRQISGRAPSRAIIGPRIIVISPKVVPMD